MGKYTLNTDFMAIGGLDPRRGEGAIRELSRLVLMATLAIDCFNATGSPSIRSILPQSTVSACSSFSSVPGLSTGMFPPV